MKIFISVSYTHLDVYKRQGYQNNGAGQYNAGYQNNGAGQYNAGYQNLSLIHI